MSTINIKELQNCIINSSEEIVEFKINLSTFEISCKKTPYEVYSKLQDNPVKYVLKVDPTNDIPEQVYRGEFTWGWLNSKNCKVYAPFTLYGDTSVTFGTIIGSGLEGEAGEWKLNQAS